MKENLWSHIISKTLPISKNRALIEEKTTVFKSKAPRRFIQVKSRVVTGGKHIIAICSDITKFKDSEIRMQKVRSKFLSQVAHELRTPMNAIIPILRMILLMLSQMKNVPENIMKYILIVQSSALHLYSIIEDCLEISRLENNKFKIYNEMFDVRGAINEVGEIMKFQIEEKGLQLDLQIRNELPHRILSDMKRFKQVLYNLIGNSLKFTFTGTIKVVVDFIKETRELKAEVSDTGIGMDQSDLNKLFKFLSCLSKTKDINRGGMGLGL